MTGIMGEGLTSFTSDWGNFLNWLNSSQGRAFCALLSIVVVAIVLGLLSYIISRLRSKRNGALRSEAPQEESDVKSRPTSPGDIEDERE